MSLAIKYENVDDAKMRLRQTVVLYKGTPVLIKDVIKGDTKDDIFRILFQEIPRKNQPEKDIFNRVRHAPEPEEDADSKRKYISSKHFDVAPFRMGYVNTLKGEGAFYCSRLPGRVQKQGLCQENFKALTNFGAPVTFATFLSTKETLAMVANDYPSFDRAVRGLDKIPSIAFHRDFCLVKDAVIPQLVFLYYKGTKVGMHSTISGEITLGAKFTCLKESLDEMLLKVGAF